MPQWELIETAPEETVILTKIDDGHGERNIQKLKRRGRLWFIPNEAMYVYYSPTHWMPCIHHRSNV